MEAVEAGLRTGLRDYSFIRRAISIRFPWRHAFSPRIRTMRAILGELRPEPVREPLPARRHYEAPSKGKWRTPPRMKDSHTLFRQVS
jgi:hypothetical protein